MSETATIGLVWLLAAAAMTAGFVWQRRHANAGVVDVLWSAGLGAGALVCALLGGGDPVARLLVGVGGGVWGARLATHLWRRVRGHPEDGRWSHLRSRWGDDDRRWFAMFQVQAALVAVFALPFLSAAANPAVGTVQALAAAAVWLLAVAGEAQADRQLARFRSDPANRGRTCRAGWWRYSRHPNYFFEWLHWFSYAILAAGGPHARLAWLGPVVMGIFLRFLSGIPFTEAQALRTQGEDYRDYQQRTSMFIPWPPRRGPVSPASPPTQEPAP